MRRRKLLIADDSEMNRAILANVLDQEFEVIEATNGQEVIELWHADFRIAAGYCDA